MSTIASPASTRSASGRPCVLVCTSGTAPANYYPAVIEAETSRVPLIVLSGAITPLESMPEAVRLLMSATPTIHFVSFAQGVLFRGAGIETVWPSLLAICVTGSVFFWIANVRLRKTIGEME